MRRVGVIGRFKPLHNGHLEMLIALSKRWDLVVIGIGSANRYNANNPFTAEESAEMIRRSLDASNYEIVFLDDYGHERGGEDGGLWVERTIEKMGPLDALVSGNPWTRSLLEHHYRLIDPNDFSGGGPSATQIRTRMARGWPWEHLVPAPVAAYLVAEGLIDRLREEYGDEIGSQSMMLYTNLEIERSRIASR